MTDLLVVLEQFPQPDSKQPIRRRACSPGGQAASAMVACARLGWRTRYVGCFGDDENGQRGRSSLADEGVDVSACRVARDTPNGLSVILVDERNGERTVLWSRDRRLRLGPDDVDTAAVCAGRALLVDCHDTAASTAAARHARRAGARTLIDVERVRDGIDALLAEIDVIITARDFPAALTGESRPGAALRAIRDAYRPALVCMTLGAEGSLALVGDAEVHTPAFRVPVVDTTGAGDVFRGGFIAGLAARRRRRRSRGRAALRERRRRAQVPRPRSPRGESDTRRGRRPAEVTMRADPIVDFSIAPHAMVQMERRGLTVEMVRRVLTEPGQRQDVRRGRVVVQSRLWLGTLAGEYLVRVFVDVDRRPPSVVTAYRTSKLDKYWRQAP